MNCKRGEIAPPTFRDVLLARRRIAPHLSRTPIFRSPLLDQMMGFSMHLKCENLQPTGAFKVRGGINLMSVVRDQIHEEGVITASSGNHGQSIAYAGRTFGVRVVVHVPENTDPIKIKAIEGLSAEVEARGRDYDEAREMAEDRAQSEGFYYVHTGNEPLLIAGVGTLGLEIMEDVPDLDVLITPIGSGTCATGAGLVAKTINPDLRLVGVQAEGADAVYRSWRDGQLHQLSAIDTAAEGLATRVAFQLPVKMLRELLDDFVLVSDDQMHCAMGTLMEMAHVVTEEAGAAAFAATEELSDELQGKRVAAVLSGGNINLDKLRSAIL